MPVTKCLHDVDSDILQSLASGDNTMSANINTSSAVIADTIGATIATAARRRGEQENCNYDQQKNIPDSIGQQHHRVVCNDFLCYQTICHQQKHQLQLQHHPLPNQHHQQSHAQPPPHPVHLQNDLYHHHHHHHHHHRRRRPYGWRRSSLFPYSPPSLNISTSTTCSTSSPSPSLSFQSQDTLSAKAGKLCSKSCITNKRNFGGGCLLRLFFSELSLASGAVRKLNFVIFILLNLLLRTCCGQLLINVQNQGGEVIQESITSNISEDLITLEFQKSDGTLITQIIDFRNEVRILKTLVLGEEERGQNLYQVMCFVTKFNKGDFISSDAMAKLRQKNPSTIRTPEEDKGKDTYIMTSWAHLNRSQPISRHLLSVCGEAPDATYIRDVDLKAWSELPGSSISSLEAATDKFPDTLSSRCNEVSSLWAPCICTLETCIGWYPCGLKYCKGKVPAGDTSAAAAAASNYRCGIKTCRKCSQYSYYVRQKQQCLWDE